MVKIKVYQGRWGWEDIGNVSFRMCYYVYTVWVFGFLVHTVTVKCNPKEAEIMFGNKIITNESKNKT